MAYPSLERKPGGPDNWVEETGGLPGYIERIAKRLHYEHGYSISRSIATAVNTVKRWSKGGTVTRRGTLQRITPATQAKAAAAVLQWEAKKSRARLDNSADSQGMDLSNPFTSEDQTRMLDSEASLPNGTFTIKTRDDLKRAIIDIKNAADPEAAKRHILTRAKVLRAADLVPSNWDLSAEHLGRVIDLALTKDGRKSFKRQGKWGHGFVPLDKAAKTAKAKGSPIAMKRMNRLYGADAKPRGNTVQDGKIRVSTKRGEGNATERTSTGRVATSRRITAIDSGRNQKVQPTTAEDSEGGGTTARARQDWNKIPEANKVTRNGKRYVLSVFRGEQQLVEWTGGADPQKAPSTATRRLVSIREVDAKKMTTAEIRRLLRVPGQPDSVKKVLNRVLAQKALERKTKR